MKLRDVEVEKGCDWIGWRNIKHLIKARKKIGERWTVGFEFVNVFYYTRALILLLYVCICIYQNIKIKAFHARVRQITKAMRPESGYSTEDMRNLAGFFSPSHSTGIPVI